LRANGIGAPISSIDPSRASADAQASRQAIPGGETAGCVK
jgi:hypothetical protein